MNFKPFILVILLCSLGVPSIAYGVLSPGQDLWFQKRNRTLLVRPEKNYPPFVFTTSVTQKVPIGLSVDYIELVKKKLNAKIQYFEPESLSTILSSIQEGKEGIVLAVTPTDSREAYLLFTRPYITVPAIIVVRKDFSPRKTQLTLEDFSGKQVAVGESYGVEEYIRRNYRKVILEPVSDDEIGIQKLLLGEVDAAVMDIASLSYYTSNNALSYVSVGGTTGFEYTLSLAVPKELPELYEILSIGLSEITPQEHQSIRNKWINVQSSNQLQKKTITSFFTQTTLIVVSIIIGAVLFFISIIIIVRALHRIQPFPFSKFYGRRMRHAKKYDTRFDHLKEELEKLEQASDLVEDELQEIRKMEHDIVEEIKKRE